MDINTQSPMPAPEHDDEGKMAKADLYKTAKYSLKLFKMMEDNAQLEGWVQAKITKAADYLASVYHYLEYEMKFTEYGRAIEDSEMYTESEKRILKKKLFEAKEKVKDLKKAQAEKIKAKDKKKVDENASDIADIHADIRGRGGDDDTKSDFNKVKTGLGVRHSRKASRVKADHVPHGDAPVTSLFPGHDERAAKFLAKQVHGRRVSPMDQLTKRKGMSDDEASEAYNPNSVDAQHRRELKAGHEKDLEDKAKAGDEHAKARLDRLRAKKAASAKAYDDHMAFHEAKASKKAKKDYDGDGEVESEKDEVIGSRRKAAGLPFKEGAMSDLDADRKEKQYKGTQAYQAKKKAEKEKTANDSKVKEAADKKCNHTPKGKSCPVHGMKECSGMMEAKPSAGMSKGEKSAVVKKAQAGKDIGKPGKSFDKVAKAAGGGEKGKKIAAAAMWKNQAK
jgi:hypothetical protein